MKILNYILAVVCGLIIGSMVNMGLIMISGSIIPPPSNADVTRMEGLKASMHLFEPKHFIFPFLAHSIGTFVGALIAAIITKTKKIQVAIIVGAVFLIGGIINVFLLPSPVWYTLVDLGLAYIPFSYTAGKLASKRNETHFGEVGLKI